MFCNWAKKLKRENNVSEAIRHLHLHWRQNQPLQKSGGYFSHKNKLKLVCCNWTTTQHFFFSLARVRKNIPNHIFWMIISLCRKYATMKAPSPTKVTVMERPNTRAIMNGMKLVDTKNEAPVLTSLRNKKISSAGAEPIADPTKRSSAILRCLALRCGSTLLLHHKYRSKNTSKGLMKR